MTTGAITSATVAAADTVADRLAHRLRLVPASGGASGAGGVAQSLADGAAGIALLHIERARADADRWGIAHAWLETAVRHPVHVSDVNGLYSGAPAVSFALHAAAGDDPGRYRRARKAIAVEVTKLTHRRVGQAMNRIRRSEMPRVREFDVINGLTGVGAHLLRHHPTSEALGRVLTYLVALSRPLHRDGTWLPGWWTDHDPHGTISAAFPGGHANHGMAHGITGPLALLSLALSRGVVVDEHREAMDRICAWLDGWRQDRPTGTWWPQWITTADLTSGRVAQPGPGRPSWCYGTPGIARAQQLAGLATADNDRRTLAETALRDCLRDSHQLDRIVDAGLCHGWAGLLHTARLVVDDTASREAAVNLDKVTGRLLALLDASNDLPAGFLEGAAGTALALHTAAMPPEVPPVSRSLLIMV